MAGDDEILVRPYLVTCPRVCVLTIILSFLIWCMQPGDIVAVNHGMYGRKEGLVIGSGVDYAVRIHLSSLPSSLPLLYSHPPGPYHMSL